MAGPLETERHIVIEMSTILPRPIQNGQPGICNDPYCTSCPTNYNYQEARRINSKARGKLAPKFHNVFYADAKGWTRRLVSLLESCLPGVMNPHAKIIQCWNKVFLISFLLAIVIDPLFFFLFFVQKDKKCIVIDWPMRTTLVILRTINDLIFLLNILLQFRLAYGNPTSRVGIVGDLTDHPKKIALNYIFGYFSLDLFIVLPLPEIIILLILPESLGSSGTNYAKDLLRTAILIQYIPKLFRLLPFFLGQTTSGFIFKSARANFIFNILTFVLGGHVVGSCWYTFGIEIMTIH